MIRLHQVPGLGRAPSLSPFCTKVETYLRMADIPYESVPSVNPRGGPTGKLPFIEDGERKIGDSGCIFDHLREKYGERLDAHLSERDHAIGHALRRMLEEHLYWAIVYTRWYDERNAPRLQELFLAQVPRPMRPVLWRVALMMMKRTLHAHGLGRHDRAEIISRANRDIDTAAAILEGRPFLFGEKPSSYDAILHAFLSSILDVDMDTPLYAHAKKKENLTAFCKRMNERYYEKAAGQGAQPLREAVA
jgi:glutathione S-transferase